MISKVPPDRELEKNIKQLNERFNAIPLLRLAGFADVINRFFDIQLKGKVNWLKTFGLVLLVVQGGVALPSELGRIMLRPSDTITKLAAALAEEGLVKRSRRGKDRRNVQIKITPAGIAFLNNVLTDIENEQKLVETKVNVTELKQIAATTIALGDRMRETIKIK